MLDPALLESFVTVARTKSFSSAAVELGRSQSTISGHIKRLEEITKRALIARNTHVLDLTPNGSLLLELARDLLRARDRVENFASDATPRDRLRFGVCDDFSISGLHHVLNVFAQENPSVDLELTIGLSIPLYARFDAGLLDVILVKRRPGDDRGTLVWRDRIVWLVAPSWRPAKDEPFSLLLFPPPSITRSLALKALEGCARDWRIGCTSDSLSGLHASAIAGLGLLPHAASLAPPSLHVAEEASLPDIGEVDFVIVKGGARAASALFESIFRGRDYLRMVGQPMAGCLPPNIRAVGSEREGDRAE